LFIELDANFVLDDAVYEPVEDSITADDFITFLWGRNVIEPPSVETVYEASLASLSEINYDWRRRYKKSLLKAAAQKKLVSFEDYTRKITGFFRFIRRQLNVSEDHSLDYLFKNNAEAQGNILVHYLNADRGFKESVKAEWHAVDLQDYKILGACDIDSDFTMSTNVDQLVGQESIEIYAYSNWSYTLNRDLNIYVDGKPLHQLKNFQLGRTTSNARLHMIFRENAVLHGSEDSLVEGLLMFFCISAVILFPHQVLPQMTTVFQYMKPKNSGTMPFTQHCPKLLQSSTSKRLLQILIQTDL
jgi:hypothetical protein